MSTKLSPEAARAKYEYNKKYQQRYWGEKKLRQNGLLPNNRYRRNRFRFPAMVWTTNGTSRLSKPRTKHSTAKIDGS